ncbi:MAG: response regulator transcription factor [Gaiellaceae bacterium]
MSNLAAFRPPRRLRVLVADDHDLFAETLSLVLAAHGVEVVGRAADGEEAVRLARSEQPDVVLMDVHMPHVDGIAATSRIAAELPDVRVLMVSSSNAGEDIVAAQAAGAVGYVLKDAPLLDMLTALVAADGRIAA